MGDKNKITKEVRLSDIKNFEIRSQEDEKKLIIEGYAAVYDQETLIGDEDFGFYERIEKGAFDGANMKDVPLKYNHSDNVPILARTRNKSLEIKTDDKGLFIRAELLDTQDNIDMYKRIQAGLIDKMSFAFTVKADGEEWEKGKIPKRTIKKFDRIFDVSVVSEPAYDGTSVFARSLELANSHIVEEKAESKKDTNINILITQYRSRK